MEQPEPMYMAELTTTPPPKAPLAPEPRVDDAKRDRRRPDATVDATGTAVYLLERRALLDRTLRVEDGSAMSRIMRRSPPIPVALVLIESEPVRERFLKLLGNANIETETAGSLEAALRCLEAHVHALLFTDNLALIQQARQLVAGAATHIVFIAREGQSRSALRVGANDCMPEEGRGEQFWAQLTTARRIASLAASLQLALRDNRILSTIDELTRCASRRFFEQEFPREVERAVRLRHPLSLVMCDIDHFKHINDSHGHPIGDEVLKSFADRLNETLRHGTDWVARVGGEEFAVVLPEATLPQAEAIAWRLCERIRDVPFQTPATQLQVTASFGLCSLGRIRSLPTELPERLINLADAALYESKRNGRDRLTTREFPDTHG